MVVRKIRTIILKDNLTLGGKSGDAYTAGTREVLIRHKEMCMRMFTAKFFLYKINHVKSQYSNIFNLQKLIHAVQCNNSNNWK